jgi:hypothetical protein
VPACQSAAGRRMASGVPRARALAFRQPLARRQRGAVKTYVMADLHWPGDRACAGPGPAAGFKFPNQFMSSEVEEDAEIYYTSPDGRMICRFSGIRYLVQTESGRSLQVTYKRKTIDELSLAILRSSERQGFGPMDPTKLLFSVLGLSKAELKIPGPPCIVDDAYPEKYDFKGRFLQLDRKFVRSMLSLIFCTSRFCAFNVSVLNLEEHIKEMNYVPSTGQRYFECVYHTGLDENDSISVIIKGNGKEPNTFSFLPSALWERKRLEVDIEISEPSTVRIEADIDMDTNTT